ncbi:pimeloyl-ACP methyl ester carboxylesterase [Salirhabdus euzebyi]|uniref:Pimeloyl-ACP methyl ester carboxylesterase n=1 Tax=Salirhabdus euzebyi TaxID=394506 RepID=A0A841PXA8_9BACI|nr:alpha/beta hydrolase [Salirhabdus euzebyi]MBB6452056.1 pimeloyl-ACP methyl ester carboxylesterase [Salirhabdus euzebyi]
MKQKRDFHIPEDGMDLVDELVIGGFKQTILIQGEKKENPILLFLHGGPSMPLPGVANRGTDYTVATNIAELVKHFNVVFWDQRGTGKSFHKDIPKESMNFDQLTSDANELIDQLIKRFDQEKIFLAAHSAGTIIGLNLVKKYPEKIISYVGLSQIISWTENDKLCYQWMLEEAKERGNAKALQELQAVGEPPYIESYKQWSVLRKWQTRFNTMVYSDDEIKHPGLLNVSKPMLQSKDYRLKDIFNTFYKGFKLIYTQHFIEKLPAINFKETVEDISVPVTFIHGRKDVHVHGRLVEDFFQRLDSKRGKKLIWMEKSAHLFHPDDTKLIEQVLIKEKKYMSSGYDEISVS